MHSAVLPTALLLQGNSLRTFPI